MDRPVAITGMGMVTAQGVGVEATWRGVVAGREVLAPWEGAPEGSALAKIRVARCGELPRPGDLPERLWRKLSRTQGLACVAVDEALASAGLPRRLGGVRAGVFLATTVCGMDQNERFYAQYRTDRDAADVELMRRLQPYEVVALIARRHRVLDDAGLRQVCLTTCVGSAMAMANAMDAIAQGECDVAIAGGAEALCRVVLSGFHALKVAAAEGCRPFDENRPGMTVGEGSGVLILESAEHVARRGGRVVAWLRGVGISCDAHHLTAPEPTGGQAMRAMREALVRAGMGADEIGYVNAHGTGTRDNDAMESRAIYGVFGGEGPPVSSTKRCIGHTFGAAAAIEAILCVKAMREGVLPANAGSVEADASCGIRVIRGEAAKVHGIQGVMSTNFAFGGNNSAIVIGRERGEIHHGGAKARRELAVEGVGIVTDGYASVSDMAREMGGPEIRVELLDVAAVGGQDGLAQLAIRAGHQAWTLAGLSKVDPERVGLLFVSTWGTIDATVAYLETMLEAGGRYASPRHFSRSVYSSVASVTAIHFGIRGPCETLTFARDPVRGGLLQARRMLQAGRAERVMIVWAEQAAEIAQDLCARAVRGLGRKEYGRYVEELGFGAVAAVVRIGNGEVQVEGGRGSGKAFAMEEAVGVVRGWVRGTMRRG